MGADTVEFPPNQIQELALKYREGKTVKGHYGDRVMFSLAVPQGKVMFLDPDVAQKIRLLDVQPGETFHLVMRWNGLKGSPRRWDAWLGPETEKARARVENPDAWPVRNEPPVVATEPASLLERQLAASITEVQQQRNGGNLLTRRPPASEPGPAPQATGTAGPQPIRKVQTSANPTPIKATYSAAMAEFLLMAGRAMSQAEKALGAEGCTIRFDSRDVAAYATTAFIQAAKEGWITWRPGEVK